VFFESGVMTLLLQVVQSLDFLKVHMGRGGGRKGAHGVT
jgi:hypothetical protein